MIHARRALIGDEWAPEVRLALDGGRISRITPGAPPAAGDIRVDALLPAPGNLHAHAFQRAMAGMTEMRAGGRDDFWSWRDTMYRFVGRLTPGQLQAIAAQAFMEMLESGFAAVGEFHYLHHQPSGTPYEDPAEMTKRIFTAAARTGIGLTHLPVLYSYGGAGARPVAGGQRRFANTPRSFARLVEAARGGLTSLPGDCRLGIAPHSLRATTPEELHEALQAHHGGPIHIHAAEQLAEVDDIRNWLGARPVEWLLDNCAIGPDWCLIHATHMTAAETTALARTGAVAGLCPITEANLGDGIFSGREFIAAGGLFGVGTDSNVGISLTGELRMLEYSQRLGYMARNVMTLRDGPVGQALLVAAAEGAAQALGRDSGRIEVGRLADLMAIDGQGDVLFALPDERLADGLIFAAPEGAVTDVWAAGRHVVRHGRHVAREEIEAGFRAAMASLREGPWPG